MFTFDVGYILFDQTKWATYPDYHLKDHLQYPCTAKAVASIAHCTAFLHLLRVEWTKDGWMDTLEEEQVWDEDAYYAHIDNLDFDFD